MSVYKDSLGRAVGGFICVTICFAAFEPTYAFGVNTTTSPNHLKKNIPI